MFFFAHGPRSSARQLLPALLLLLTGSAPAQTHRVSKPEKVTRAVAVYEWTGDLNKPTASRLVPVSLFIDGHLEDAGVYLARPVPFALNAGYVYSVEKGGEPLGTVDLEEARNLVTRRSSDDDNPLSAWFGYGRYIPPPAVPKAPVLKTSAHPGVLVSSTAASHSATAPAGRPHLADRSGADDSAKSTGKSQAPAPASSGPRDSSTTPPASATEPASKNEDPDRPHLSRRTDAPAEPSGSLPTATSSPSSDDSDRPHMSRRNDAASPTDNEPAPPAKTSNSTTTAAEDDPERPTLRRRDTKAESKAESKKRKESGSGVTPMATSLNDDPDRPSLRRGSEAVPAGTPPLSGNPPGLQQAVAVSDPAIVDNHPFLRAWESSTERSSTLAAFEVLAKPRITNYLALNQLTAGPASAQAHTAVSSAAPPAVAQEDTGGPPKLQRGKPASGQPSGPAPAPAPTTASANDSRAAHATPHASAAVRKPAAPPSTRRSSRAQTPAPLLLADEQLTGFTLSYGGLPTFVYSAQTPVTTGSPIHLTLVAQQLPSGELQVALSSLTDEAHLDRTPWMRLIDVVDPTDSHRASFVFELRAKASRQFALYSLVSSQAEQNFATGLMQ